MRSLLLSFNKCGHLPAVRDDSFTLFARVGDKKEAPRDRYEDDTRG